MNEIAILAKKLVQLLREQSLQITCAESCTGGGVAYYLTSVAGSSKVFNYGFIVYSDLAKQELLGVSPQTLADHGAVSSEVVAQMCAGACNTARAAVGIAISGIAGPDGGSAHKPVGLVWIAWQHAGKIVTKSFNFAGDRAQIREQAISTALKDLISLIS